jgi:hypothetical protein
MHQLQKATMSLMVFLMFAIIMASKAQAGLDPKELIGEYLGSGDCGVVVSLYGDDQLRFSIQDRNGEVAHDFIPFYRLETLGSPDQFEFERETIGISGEEKKVVSGTIRGHRLGSLKLKTVRSLFSFSTESCYGLAPLAPYMSEY